MKEKENEGKLKAAVFSIGESSGTRVSRVASCALTADWERGYLNGMRSLEKRFPYSSKKWTKEKQLINFPLHFHSSCGEKLLKLQFVSIDRSHYAPSRGEWNREEEQWRNSIFLDCVWQMRRKKIRFARIKLSMRRNFNQDFFSLDRGQIESVKSIAVDLIAVAGRISQLVLSHTYSTKPNFDRVGRTNELNKQIPRSLEMVSQSWLAFNLCMHQTSQNTLKVKRIAASISVFRVPSHLWAFLIDFFGLDFTAICITQLRNLTHMTL